MFRYIGEAGKFDDSDRERNGKDKSDIVNNHYLLSY